MCVLYHHFTRFKAGAIKYIWSTKSVAHEHKSLLSRDCNNFTTVLRLARQLLKAPGQKKKREEEGDNIQETLTCELKSKG